MAKWSKIKNAEYSVSSDGDVRNDKTGRILNPFESRLGYLQVRLKVNGKNKTFYLHRLVAETFVKNPDGKKDINHKDGNIRNNKASNLEWGSEEEAIKMAYRSVPMMMRLKMRLNAEAKK